MLADERTGLFSQMLTQVLIVEKHAQRVCGGIYVRVRPFADVCVADVVLEIIVDWNRDIWNGHGVVGSAEFGCRGYICHDSRNAKMHGLGHAETETFATVQGKIDVGTRRERVKVVLAEIII